MVNKINSLESAKEADKKGELLQWTIDFLQGEGKNDTLAEHIKTLSPTIVVLKKFPLNRLKRIVGPEKEMMFTEEVELWEKRVASMVDSLKSGRSFPPLLVTDFWNSMDIADGGHRFEALTRYGIDSYWTIFLFTNRESLELIEPK